MAPILESDTDSESPPHALQFGLSLYQRTTSSRQVMRRGRQITCRLRFDLGIESLTGPAVAAAWRGKGRARWQAKWRPLGRRYTEELCMLGWTWGHAEWRRLDYGLGYAGSVDVSEGVFVIGMSGNECVGQSQ